MYFFLESKSKPKGAFDYEKTCLIIKTDAIGDYILFRNFLAAIKRSKKFQGYNIYVCGNEVYQDLAEHYDKEFVTKFYWINRKKFTSDLAYRKMKLEEIRQFKHEYVVQPSYSREFLIGDSLVRAVISKYRIGAIGDDANDVGIFKAIANGFYTNLYSIDENLTFEFDRNKNLMEQVIEERVSFNTPHFENCIEPKEQYVVLFPGAGEVIKQWSSERFASIARYIYEKYKRNILICGSPADRPIGEKIVALSGIPGIQNLCGKTNLVQLVQIIQRASLLVTNDSSAFHIGASTKTETISLFMGRHYGRFAPYTDTSIKYIHYVYPASFQKLLETMGERMMIEATKYQSPSRIEEITIKQVADEVDRGLK